VEKVTGERWGRSTEGGEGKKRVRRGSSGNVVMALYCEEVW
jgi:hypothetical protein